jgi:hypothetical protein
LTESAQDERFMPKVTVSQRVAFRIDIFLELETQLGVCLVGFEGPQLDLLVVAAAGHHLTLPVEASDN